MKLNKMEVEQLIKNNLPMPSHIKHIEGGGVTITSAYTYGDSWSELTSIGGGLSVGKGCEINLSALTRISGYLYLEEDAHADLPALTRISGYLYLEKDAHADLSALTSIDGGLYLENCSHADLSALTSIGVNLTLKKDVHADLSALTSIGVNLTLKKDVHADLSALTSIDGGFNIDEYTDPLPTQLRHLETREAFKLIYQAEEIASQVASSGGISVIKRRASL